MKILFYYLILANLIFISCTDNFDTNSCTKKNCIEDYKYCIDNICILKDNSCERNSDCAGQNVYCDGIVHECKEISNPCDGVTCSNHGICIANQNNAVCICDNGYHAQELECIKDSNPCDGVTCSNHGICIANQNNAVCICDNGYKPINLECTIINKCFGVNCNEWENCNPLNGICRPKEERCNNNGDCSGQNVYCDSETHSCNNKCIIIEEICDGKDNDCDGVVDEGCDCINGDAQECGDNIGECRKGLQTCISGSWGACENQILPTEEICDGKDNDCDGLVDEADSSSMIKCLIQRGGNIYIQEGVFEFDNELKINKPINLIGLGKDLTKLKFNITRDESSLRVLSNNVTISDLDINVNLIHSLNDGFYSGGRGEYGTGITIGKYLSTIPQNRMSNISINNISISRSGFVAAAISVVGNSVGINIENIELKNYHSTAIIIHWGGYSSVEPAPSALVDPSYELYETYHPSNIFINNITINQVARFFILSSCYNINIQNISGKTAEILTALPGDEINLYANILDKDKILSNIKMKNINANIYMKKSEHIIRMTSVGTSKIDKEDLTCSENCSYIKRYIPYKNLLLENINILTEEYDVKVCDSCSELKRFRYGLNLNGFYGENNIFKNINLENIASFDYYKKIDNTYKIYPSYGVYMNNSSGIFFKNISLKSRYGFGIVNSNNIIIEGDCNNNINGCISHNSHNSNKKSYGVYLAQKNNGEIYDIKISNIKISNYDYGIYFYQNPSDSIEDCKVNIQDVTLSNINNINSNYKCE